MLASYMIPRNSHYLTSASTPRILHEDLLSEDGATSRKQSLAQNVQIPPEYDENSNAILNEPQNTNERPYKSEEEDLSSDDFESMLFDPSGEKLNPEIEKVVNKVYDWIINDDKYQRYQEEDDNEKEDFFRWISEEERAKIIEDVVRCFQTEEGYEILTDVEVEQRYFAKNFDAIPLHLLLVHSTEDLLDSLENVMKVPSAGEKLYTIEDESFDLDINADVKETDTSYEVEECRCSSSESGSSLDLTQSSYANSSFGFQTEWDFDELVNGVSCVELSCEDRPSHLEDLYVDVDDEVIVEFPDSFFDNL